MWKGDGLRAQVRVQVRILHNLIGKIVYDTHLGASSEEGVILARATKKALSRRDFFFFNFVVAALRARICSAASGKLGLPEYFLQV